MQRIHIVGCGPRTGTTLLTELMISSFEIDLHTDHEDRIAKCPPRNGKVFLTKSPKDIVLIEPILKWVKNLHVIYMLRDPRDMIVSKHRSNKDQYYSNLEYWFNFMPFAKRLQGHPRFMQIRYRDLVNDPDGVQDLIRKKHPFLIQKHKFSEYHKVAKPSSDSKMALGDVRPVSGGSIGNWRQHKARVLGQIRLHGSISDDLIELGYEEDTQWEKELEGVVPDLSKQHPSNFYKKSWVRHKQRGKYIRAARVWFYHLPITLWFLEVWYRLTHGKDESS